VALHNTAGHNTNTVLRNQLHRHTAAQGREGRAQTGARAWGGCVKLSEGGQGQGEGGGRKKA
jgi:hypothetical protein